MYKLVLTEDEMNDCLRVIGTTSKLVYDVETSGLNPRRNHIVGYVLTVGPKAEDTYYVPVRHAGGGNCLDWKGLETEVDENVPLHPFEIELAKAVKSVSTVVGHNLCFDLLFSARKGIFFDTRTECTQTAMALINENMTSFSLDSCAKYMNVTQKLGDRVYFHMAKLFGGEPDRKQMKNFWKLAGNDEVGADYAAGDGVSTWELNEAQAKEIVDQELQVVWDVECRVTNTLFRMQNYGIKIDVAEIDNLVTNVTKLMEEAKEALPAGLNINSAKQIKAWFDLEGITGYPITEKGNASFTAEYLDTNELGKKILTVRKLTTLMDRFVTPMKEEHLFEGRIFPNYNQLRADDFGTVTGRLSCNNPNIQQVYKRDKWLGKIFRKIFIPDEGMQWVGNDFSGCEPRIYASYSKSPLLIDGYLADPPVDFYQTLSNITGIPRSPTAGVAGNCKQLALAIFYGAGEAKTAQMLGVTIAEARKIRNMVQTMCPEIKAFSNEAKHRAESRGYVKTVLGRRARFPDNMYTNKAAGRIVQGCNADLIKLSLVEVDDYLKSLGLPPPICTIHDSVELQVPIGRQDIIDEIARIMNNAAQGDLICFSVPQKVDTGVGPNWSIATYGEEA